VSAWATGFLCTCLGHRTNRWLRWCCVWTAQGVTPWLPTSCGGRWSSWVSGGEPMVGRVGERGEPTRPRMRYLVSYTQMVRGAAGHCCWGHCTMPTAIFGLISAHATHWTVDGQKVLLSRAGCHPPAAHLSNGVQQWIPACVISETAEIGMNFATMGSGFSYPFPNLRWHLLAQSLS
jgi:hypothetical protein